MNGDVREMGDQPGAARACADRPRLGRRPPIDRRRNRSSDRSFDRRRGLRGAAILDGQPDTLCRESENIIIIHRAGALTGDEPPNRLMRVIGPDRAGAATDCRQAAVYVVRLEPGAEVVHCVAAGGAAFVYLADGAASLDREDLSTGDVAAITDQRELAIRAWQASEVVLVDVAIAPGDAREPADDRR